MPRQSRSLTGGSVSLLYRIFLARCEFWFERFGRSIAEHPPLVIFFSLLFVTFCGFGLLNLKVERETEKLFVPENSNAEDALKISKPYFVNILNSREQSVIFEGGSSSKLFSPSCLRQVQLVLDPILSDPTYRKLCLEKPRYLDNTQQYNRLRPCFLINPLELISNISTAEVDIRTTLKDNKTLMSNGRTANSNRFQMFNNANNGKIQSIRVVLYLKEYENNEEKKQVLEWEKKFVQSLEQMVKKRAKQSCFSIRYSARRSLDDAIQESSGTDVPLVSIAFTLMITFSRFALGRFTNPIQGHSFLSNFGILSTAFGILTGFGLSALIGIPFVSLIGILPFLVISIGIDDMFIIIGEFDAQSTTKSPIQRVGSTMARVGPTITMTTLTDIIAFLVSSSSSFPAVRYFCIYAAITFTAEFLLQVTLFLAFLTYDAFRIDASRRDCLPCWKGEDKQVCCSKVKSNLSSVAMKWYAKKLLTVPGKIIGFTIALGLLALGVYGCCNVGTDFDRRTLIKKSSYLETYLDTYELNFDQTIIVNIVQDKKVDYEDKNIQKEILMATEIACQTGYYFVRSPSWLKSFLMWDKDLLSQGRNQTFYNRLQLFLSTPQFSSYKSDLRFDESNTIVASQTPIFMKHTTSSNFQRDAMLELRKAFANHGINLVPTSDQFLYFEQYAAVIHEIIQNVCISAAVILVITAPFCIYWSVSCLLLLGFILLIVELFGLMYFWDVSLNAVSMINLVMAIGFTVDYSAHVAHAFVTSEKLTVNDKIEDALATIGAGILLGGFSTFLGMLTTAFASSEIFQIFFKMFFGIVVIGLFNGLVLLPILFSFLASSFSDSKRLEEERRKTTLQFKNPNKMKKHEKIHSKHHQMSISIVGIAARFPTARNKEEFWKLLVEGRNTLRKYPSDRGLQCRNFNKAFNPSRGVKGRLYVTDGSYLEDVDMFDHNFFGISQTEASMMDPQQRILLQGVFEAIEDAGITLSELQSLNTGVYVGAMNLDHTALINEVNEFDINQFTGTGTSAAIIANRISFALNLRGPSLSVDTACSSSLTALSIAIEHLNTGRCDIAIVGAPNIVIDPMKQLILCQARMLAPDGQSKCFDTRCDGYGRGEGMVVMILKPSTYSGCLDNSIYCNILACSLNSDGQSAIPMTAPSVAGQCRLFESTCMAARISPSRVGYVEAHGTGTVIGDLVETQSISQAYCQNRSNGNPLRIGSVKSNVNHTESTAGLAGLAKVCLMMDKRQFVPTVGIQELNSKLSLRSKSLHVNQVCEEWPSDAQGLPRCAAVNSFGFGGSNAHIIVEEQLRKQTNKICSIQETYNNRDGKYLLLVLSSKSKAGLFEQAKTFADWLSSQDDEPQLALDLCYSLSLRRTIHSHRLTIAFKTIEEAMKGLYSFANEDVTDNMVHSVSCGRAKLTPPKVGFVFGGQGSDWEDMIDYLSLHDDLKSVFEEVDQAVSSSSIAKNLLKDLSRVSFEYFSDNYSVSRVTKAGKKDVKSLNHLTLLQLSIFKVQYAISRLLIDSCRIIPVALVGHSLGDIVAACISGCISLSNAVDIIIVRSELQNICRQDGKMAALGMSYRAAKELISTLHLEENVTVAAINDAESVTVSGDQECIAKLRGYIVDNAMDVFWKELPTAKAYHSHHMDTIKALFWKYVTRIKFTSNWNTIQFISSVYAKPMKAKQLTAAYWWDNIREPVNFYGAISEMLTLDCQVIVEISPRPVLKTYLKKICSSLPSERKDEEVAILTAFPSTRVDKKIEHLYCQCIGQLFNIGCTVNFSNLMDFDNANFVRYPPYKWQETKLSFNYKPTFDGSNKTLLGTLVGADRDGSDVYQSFIDLHKLPFLEDHILDNLGPVYPGVCYIEMIFEACTHSATPQCLIIENQTFDKVLTLSEEAVQPLRTVIMKDNDKGKLHFNMYNVVNHADIKMSSADVVKFNEDPKALQLSEIVSASEEELNEIESYDIQRLKRTATKTMCRADILAVMNKKGLKYGKAFSLHDQAWFVEDKILVKFTLVPEVFQELSSFVIHPSIIDGFFSTVLLAQIFDDFTSLAPVGFEKLMLFPVYQKGVGLYSLVTYDIRNKDSCSVQLMTSKGETLLMARGMKVVDLQKIPPKLSQQESLHGVNYSPGSLQQFSTLKIETIRWVVVGLADKQLHNLFTKHLKGIGCNDFEVVDLRVVWENKKLISLPTDRITNALSADKYNIILNFVPSYVDEMFSESNDIDKMQQLLFCSCFENVHKLLQRENSRLEFITAEAISFLMQDGPSLPDFSSARYPLSATVWGYAKCLRLEMPSSAIQCADISVNTSQADFDSLITHCTSDLSQPDVIIRQGQLYFPKANLLDDGRNNKTLQISAGDIHSIPHCLTLDHEGQFVTLEDRSLQTLQSEHVKVQVSFASSLSSHLDDIPHTSTDRVHILDKHMVCYSGTIIENDCVGIGTPVLTNVLLFQATDRIRNCVNAAASSIVEVPEAMTLEQGSVLPGSLSIASMIIKYIYSLIPSCKSCLIATSGYESMLSPSLMLAAKAVDWNVSTTDMNYINLMSSLGIRFINIQDLFREYNFQDNETSRFDCVVLPTDSNEAELSIYTSKLKQDGICLAIRSQGSNVCQQWNGCPIGNTSTKYHIYDCSKVSEEELLNEWKRICPLLMEKESAWHTALEGKFDIIDPYNKIEVKKNSMSDCAGAIRVNSSDQSTIEIENCLLDHKGVNADKTYLVIGGHKGLGMETSLWLARIGAKSIITCGRSQLPEDAEKRFRYLEAKERLHFQHVACDITSAEGIKSLESALQELPKLGGIICSAVVYDDRLIDDIDYLSFSKVLGPKVTGVIRLHELVCRLKINLDFFVLYSSIVSVMGNIGQASYSAANVFMNEFANRMKQWTGQNYLSICWGPMSGAGFLSTNAKVADNIVEKMGLNLIPIQTGLDWMESVLLNHSNSSTVIINSFNWNKASDKNHILRSIPMIRHLVPDIEGDKNNNDLNYSDMIRRCTTQEEKYSIVAEFIKNWLSNWLGVAEISEVDLNSPLSQYGLDSAGAIGFQNRLYNDFMVTIPVYELLRPDSTGNSLIDLVLQGTLLNDAKPDVPTEDQNKELPTNLFDDDDMDDNDKNELDGEDILPIDDSFCAAAYSPTKARAKFFWIHSSHRYKGRMLSLAEGFQIQEVFQMFSIGSDDILYKAGDAEMVRPLAATYVKLILKKQPRGPFFLGGYSFGGLVALEVASILTAMKENVAMLVMLDTFPWLPKGAANADFLMRATDNLKDNDQSSKVPVEIKSFLRSIAIDKLGMDLQTVEQMLEEESTDEIFNQLTNFAVSNSVDIPDLRFLSEAVIRNGEVSKTAHNSWDPPKKMYKGPVLYIEALDTAYSPHFKGLSRRSFLWKEIIRPKQFYLHTVNCHHYKMLETNRGVKLGRIICTMARFILRQKFPYLYEAEVTPIDRISVQLMKTGLPTVLGQKNKGIPGILKVSDVKKRLKFKAKKQLPVLSQRKLIYPLKDIVNILKASDANMENASLTSMGIVIWTQTRKTAFYFETWRDYIRVVNGLQAVSGMRLSLV